MAETNGTITIKRGASFAPILTVRDTSGQPRSLSGLLISSQVRTPSGSHELEVVRLDDAAGRLQLRGATDDWQVGAATWDVRLEDPEGNVVFLPRGRVIDLRIIHPATRLPE